MDEETRMEVALQAWGHAERAAEMAQKGLWVRTGETCPECSQTGCKFGDEEYPHPDPDPAAVKDTLSRRWILCPNGHCNCGPWKRIKSTV